MAPLNKARGGRATGSWRAQATLGDRARGVAGILEALELERRRRAVARSVLQPHPGLGNDPERPLDPISRRGGSGPAPPQLTRLVHPARRDGAHALANSSMWVNSVA